MSSDPNHAILAERGRDRGFALLLVIWVVALLAVLAASVAADSTREAVIARNRVEAAQARALADAGVALALAGLDEANPATRWPADGTPRLVSFGGGTIAIAIQDEGGKADLNLAPLDFIAGLLAELGVPPHLQTLITNGIAARRRQFAASISETPSRYFFSRTIYNFTPADEPFASRSELRLIPGVTRRLYLAIRPYVTIYSENATINPMTAPAAVLRGIPGVRPGSVTSFLTARQAGGTAVSTALPKLASAAAYLGTEEVRAVTVIARATTPSGASFTREAVVGLSPGLPLHPFSILRWRQAINLR